MSGDVHASGLRVLRAGSMEVGVEGIGRQDLSLELRVKA